MMKYATAEAIIQTLTELIEKGSIEPTDPVVDASLDPKDFMLQENKQYPDGCLYLEFELNSDPDHNLGVYIFSNDKEKEEETK